LNIKNKICDLHKIEYDYVCSKCIEPLLKNTSFRSLEDIRKFQKLNARKVNLKDVSKTIKSIGLMKSKIFEEFAYSGIFLYDIEEKCILGTEFKKFNPIFTNYYPTILFLNHTDIYLDLIKDLKLKPECYIINASGQIHPYLFGAACDLGLKIHEPIIGYTKKLLYGIMEEIDSTLDIPMIWHKSQHIGYAIPKPNSKKYYYISVGNNISLQTAAKLLLSLDLNIISILTTELNNFIKKKEKKS